MVINYGRPFFLTHITRSNPVAVHFLLIRVRNLKNVGNFLLPKFKSQAQIFFQTAFMS